MDEKQSGHGSHGPNLGLPSLTTNMNGLGHSGGHHGPTLGNFQFANPLFDLPAGLQTSLAPLDFKKPEFGSSSGFAPVADLDLNISKSNYSPGFFSPPNSSIISCSSDDKTKLNLIQDLFKELNTNSVPGLGAFDLVSNAAEHGKSLAGKITHDQNAGHGNTEATVCNTLGVLATAGTDFFLKADVLAAEMTGLTASAGLMATGVLTADPLLVSAGGASGMFFVNMALPAYEGAGKIAETSGEVVKDGCYYFEQALSGSTGPKK